MEKALLLPRMTGSKKNKILVKGYLKKFVEDPHTEIILQKMSVSFNPGNIIALEDKGTVYPNMRIVDNWGILTVTNGGLMSPEWNKINLTAPESIKPDLVKGDGWEIELKPGWQIVKDIVSGNYMMKQL